MSTIERAAARLGAIGKVRAEPILRDPATEAQPTPSPTDGYTVGHARPAASRIGGGFCEIDVGSLNAAGFATPQSGNVQIAADLRRIKRPLLMAIKKSAATEPRGLPHNLVLITSAVPGEGKTFVSINLALSMAAELDRTVLLVDADVAKNDIARVFGVSYESGLTDVLERSGVHPEDCVLQTNIESLSFLPSGRMLPNVDELFASEKMSRMMRELAERDPNRIVIVDGPPLHAGTEASVLARMVGHVVVLVEADKTSKSLLEEGLHELRGCESVSMVLNKSRRSSDVAYGYGYGYGYGSQRS